MLKMLLKERKMNETISKLLKEKTTPQNYEKVYQALELLRVEDGALRVTLKDLQEALSGEGEFVIVEGDYSEFETQEYKTWLKRKLCEAIEIVVVFEDDGTQFEKIEEIAAFIYTHTSSMQKVKIGVKKVEQLSTTPLRVLFAEIYPINQLEMFLGSDIFEFIEQNKEYFEPYFEQIRMMLWREIGVAILPLLPQKSQNLAPNGVCLRDRVTQKRIVEFEVEQLKEPKDLDLYLQKLFYIFVKLSKNYKH